MPSLRQLSAELEAVSAMYDAAVETDAAPDTAAELLKDFLEEAVHNFREKGQRYCDMVSNKGVLALDAAYFKARKDEAARAEKRINVKREWMRVNFAKILAKLDKAGFFKPDHKGEVHRRIGTGASTVTLKYKDPGFLVTDELKLAQAGFAVQVRTIRQEARWVGPHFVEWAEVETVTSLEVNEKAVVAAIKNGEHVPGIEVTPGEPYIQIT